MKNLIFKKKITPHRQVSNGLLLHLAFHNSVNGQKSVRASVTLHVLLYLQAKHQIPVKISVKNNFITIYICYKYCFACSYPGNADYFDFSAAEMIAAGSILRNNP